MRLNERMDRIVQKTLSSLFDVRVIIAIIGVIMSIVMHELFHIILHWNEIIEVGLFPDRHAIFEVLFVPTADDDIVVEEIVAYAITMATLVITAMIINDINELRDKRSVSQIVMNNRSSKAQNKANSENLATLLGIEPLVYKTTASKKRKKA